MRQGQALSGMLEFAAAVDEVVSLATQTIRVFDRDLREGGWRDARRYDQLKAFLLGGGKPHLYIVVHEVDHLVRDCPRLLTLLRQHSEAVSIHQTTAEARSAYDPLIIVDSAHYVHRFHYEQPRGERVLNDPEWTQIFLRRFEEIWLASTPAVAATTLGL